MPVSPSSALPSNLLRRYQPELVQYMPLSQARIQTPGLALYADPVHTLTHLLVGYSVDGCIPHTMALMNAVGIHGLPDDIDSYYPTPRELILDILPRPKGRGFLLDGDVPPREC